MSKNIQFSISINENLLRKAQQKCKSRFDITLSALIKVFLASFASQKGVGFYIGDDDICQLFNRWVTKKTLEKDQKGGFKLPHPRLMDLYDLGNKKAGSNFN